MTTLRRLLKRSVALFALVFPACGGPRSAPVQVHPVEKVRLDGGQLVVVDTDSTIWPDPVDRTWSRLVNVQYLVAEFEQTRGRLPERLEDVLPTQSAPAAMRVDAWENPLHYEAAGTEYVITAAGPDGLFGTADDLRAGRNTRPPERPVDPGRLTRGVLNSLQLAAQAFWLREGVFPDSIAALAAGGIKPLLGDRDGWGNSVVYTREARRLEFRSFGPDELEGTQDDIVLVHPVP